jgi:NADH:ubiquinone oxidoreductase subunit E
MRFTFETVACLGTCFLAPVVMIDNDYYGQLTPSKIPAILRKYQKKG